MDKRSINPVIELKKYRQYAGEMKDNMFGLCVFSTVDEEGFPQTRIIELKEIFDDKLAVLINNSSPKWKHLHQSNKYQVLIYWHTVPLQARIYGTYLTMDKEQAEDYWKIQPYNYRILDFYYDKFSAQSDEIFSQKKFIDEIISLKEAFPDNNEGQKMPQGVEGLFLIPNKIEFWQGSHDFKIPVRTLFTLQRNGWVSSQILP